MATRERRRFTAEFKREAVKLAEQPGRFDVRGGARAIGYEPISFWCRCALSTRASARNIGRTAPR